jgi:hypothetical protein
MKNNKIIGIALLAIVLLFPYASSAIDVVPCIPGMPGGCDSPSTVKGIIVNFTYWLLGIFGFLAVIAFVIYGIMYLTAAGDEEQIKRAKRGMIYGIIGVVVGLGGLVIMQAISTLINAGSGA